MNTTALISEERLRSFVRIAHSIPGRLRLYCPPLRGMPEAESVLVTGACKELTRNNICEAVSVDFRTGSILIRYNPTLTDPETIMKALFATAARHLARQRIQVM